MSYYIPTTVDTGFDETISNIKAALQAEGFGVLSEIDVQKTLKEKIGEDFRPYMILGACNPNLAHHALSTEDKIGVLLPCNIIVQETDGRVEVAAVDPVTSLGSVNNPDLEDTAADVKARLSRVINAL